MAAEMMNADPPMKNSIKMEFEEEEEEAFHNAADSFSTGEPEDDNKAAEGDLFQEVENRSPDVRERDDLKEKSSETAVAGKEMMMMMMKKGKRSSRRSNGKKAAAAASASAAIKSDELDEWSSNNNNKRRVYSREEMVGMRFFGVVQQKRLWRDIYNGLGTAAAEYASLVDHAKNPKHPPRNHNNNYNHPPSVGILGGAIVGGGGTASPYNVIVQPYYPTMMNTCYSPEWPYVSYGF